MSYETKENGFAARISARGFAFSVAHAFAPIIDRGQAFLQERHARAVRRRGQLEIDELPDYLRDDIGVRNGKHNKL
ncbi:hypothetical protein [Pararhizobium sp.]|uniref:hypothetical protein n=1 Tax=Pararhizobium sp. TaxID=1977563 RepID=UPI0027261C34|nr:hypothetical protein [Pararhizobium sp.]MDO9418731.1 hypothetical protein [Pararhizobium sp.]